MLTHLNNAQNHPDQGMTPQDILACQQVADRRNEIIIFRSTGPWSRPHIAAGHPTKPFHVKGKSATWGPQAGFVPFDSKYSKAISQRDIDKGRKANKEAIKNRYARPIPLVLSNNYIQQLTANRGMTNRPAVDRITSPRDGIKYFYCRKPDINDQPGAVTSLFLGKQDAAGSWEIFAFEDGVERNGENAIFLRESAAQPLLVMAVPGSDLPVTGDYDLFTVCPNWNSYGPLDKKMDPTLDDPKQNASFARTRAKANIAAPQPDQQAEVARAQRSVALINAAATNEDPDRGNITRRLFQVIVELNAAMGVPYGPGMQIGQPNRYQGGVVNQRVHHNAESGRPFAPGADDGFPLTLFHPAKQIGPYNFRNAVIDSYADMKNYFKTIYRNGYQVPRNHAWDISTLHPHMPGYT